MDGKESDAGRPAVGGRVVARACVAALVLGVAGCGGSATTPDAASTGSSAGGAASAATAAAASTSTAGPRTRTGTGNAASSAQTASSSKREGAGGARVALEQLPVKGRAPKTGYSREAFGDGWTTVNGCDTRNRILKRDLTRKTFVAGSDCEVESGHLNDPYTAAAITYDRGGVSEVDVDHVVALGDAWQKGAQQWSAARREKFANDRLNLMSVDAGANRQKGDGDAATWLPPNTSFRCEYVARQIAVKIRYEAWVTRAEHDAMARVLSRCPDEELPKSGAKRVPVVPTHREAATPSAPRPTPKARTRPAAGEGHVFANCDAVRAAGLAPLRRGTADYAANPNLDRDGDGLACE